MSAGNFGTYQRMCGFGGGECCSGFLPHCESVRIDEYGRNTKMYFMCIGKGLNPIPPCIKVVDSSLYHYVAYIFYLYLIFT